MSTRRAMQWVERLIWILAYAGLLSFVLGLATARIDAGLGLWLIVCGLCVAAIGFSLIWVRSRMSETP